MAYLAKNTNPESDIVELICERTGKAISHWSEYSCSSNFFTPTDGWSFTVGEENIQRVREAVTVGDKIRIAVNGIVQCTGYVDSLESHAEVGAGSIWTYEGRDALAMAVDGCIDPRVHFKASMTLEDVVRGALEPFFEGSSIEFQIDNDANQNVLTGQTKGKKYSKTTRTKRGKVRGGKALRKYTVDQLKPHMGEGAFAFATRIANRFGLWIWCSADGEKIVVGHPSIEPGQGDGIPYRLTRISSNPSQNNIKSGGVKIDLTEQPSCIIADGASGGGTFGHSKVMARIVNPFTGYDADGFVEDSVSEVFAKYSKAMEIIHEGYPSLHNYKSIGIARPVWLHDEESHNEEQLEGFIRRELSLRLRKAVVARYRVMGHGQMVGGSFAPWTVDTQVYVQDEQSGIDEMMWVQSRRFFRAAGTSGSYTDIELIRLSSVEF